MVRFLIALGILSLLAATAEARIGDRIKARWAPAAPAACKGPGCKPAARQSQPRPPEPNAEAPKPPAVVRSEAVASVETREEVSENDPPTPRK